MAKLQAFCPVKGTEGARTLKTAPANRSSEEERRVDAKALIAEEGRDKLRKAMGSRK